MNNQNNQVFSFNTAIDFEEKILLFSNELVNLIDKKGKIELPDPTESLVRVKILLFSRQSLKLFINRTEFILDYLKRENIEMEKLEILRTLLRGLLEIYLKFVYLNNIREPERIKRIIWKELYVSALVIPKKESKMISSNYAILNKFNINFPDFQEFSTLVQNYLKFDRTSMKELNKLRKDYDYPSIRNIIKECYHSRINEEPVMPEFFISYIYSVFSEQIHANQYFEGIGEINIRYQLLGFLTQIYLKFLKEITKLIKEEEEIDKLIEEWKKNIKPNFTELWLNQRAVNYG